MRLSESEIFEGERGAKASEALARFRLTEVTEPGSAGFEEAYGALDAEFGPRAEMERREVIVSRMTGRFAPPEHPLHIRYHLLSAHDADGTLAGVRDCCVSVHPETRRAVVYLAHTLVLPDYRRTGLAALFRAAPAAFARRLVAEAGGDPEGADILLGAEMEPVEPENRSTVVRLLAYARAGFSAIPPQLLPYCQPDMRDLDALGEPARPIPLVPIIRWVGHEMETEIPAPLAAAYVRHLYAIYGLHSREQDLADARRHAIETLASKGLDRVPLLRLPRGAAELSSLAPLLRSAVLPLYPPQLRGLAPEPTQSVAEQLEALLETWKTN